MRTWEPAWSGRSQLSCSQWLRLHGLASSDLGLRTWDRVNWPWGCGMRCGFGTSFVETYSSTSWKSSSAWKCWTRTHVNPHPHIGDVRWDVVSRHGCSYLGVRTWEPAWSGRSQLPCSQWLRLHGLTSSDLGLRTWVNWPWGCGMRYGFGTSFDGTYSSPSWKSSSAWKWWTRTHLKPRPHIGDVGWDVVSGPGCSDMMACLGAAGACRLLPLSLSFLPESPWVLLPRLATEPYVRSYHRNWGDALRVAPLLLSLKTPMRAKLVPIWQIEAILRRSRGTGCYISLRRKIGLGGTKTSCVVFLVIP